MVSLGISFLEKVSGFKLADMLSASSGWLGVSSRRVANILLSKQEQYGTQIVYIWKYTRPYTRFARRQFRFRSMRLRYISRFSKEEIGKTNFI